MGMSPRKNRRQLGGPSAGDRGGTEDPPASGWFGGFQDTEEATDGDWIVRQVAGTNATKAYRCPGCDQEIPPGIGHLVAWPADSRGADDRRHWHKPCWQARLRRAPRTKRSRNAPRH
ncbi:MAG: hypothetical protein QOE54_6847 [Streptosporangiaceae bacterium]|jgi:hypothetical protein|nr:hypothetical protein [Streptosporangiaceae bacterium]MDX6434481.1 hypothetical protein [Streptosporangiaceae bacterium]